MFRLAALTAAVSTVASAATATHMIAPLNEKYCGDCTTGTKADDAAAFSTFATCVQKATTCKADYTVTDTVTLKLEAADVAKNVELTIPNTFAVGSTIEWVKFEADADTSAAAVKIGDKSVSMKFNNDKGVITLTGSVPNVDEKTMVITVTDGKVNADKSATVMYQIKSDTGVSSTPSPTTAASGAGFKIGAAALMTSAATVIALL